MEHLRYFVFVWAIPVTNIYNIICTINVTINKWSKTCLGKSDSSKFLYQKTIVLPLNMLYWSKIILEYSTLVIKINFQIM